MWAMCLRYLTRLPLMNESKTMSHIEVPLLRPQRALQERLGNQHHTPIPHQNVFTELPSVLPQKLPLQSITVIFFLA